MYFVFWGGSALQGFNLFYGESGVLGNDSGIDTILLEFASHFDCIFCTTFGYTFRYTFLTAFFTPFSLSLLESRIDRIVLRIVLHHAPMVGNHLIRREI